MRRNSRFPIEGQMRKRLAANNPNWQVISAESNGVSIPYWIGINPKGDMFVSVGSDGPLRPVETPYKKASMKLKDTHIYRISGDKSGPLLDMMERAE